MLVYDGDCGFCRRWIARWRSVTADRVAYAPYQEVAERYPHIPRSEFAKAAQFIDANGHVSGGAEGVLRALSYAPGKRWMLWCYQRIPGVGLVSRQVYGFVAGHRRQLSRVTSWLWGAELRYPTYHLARWWFLRGLGVVYLIAFLSLAVQIVGLVGENGISPAAEQLPWWQEKFGSAAYWAHPTLCWLTASDGFLRLLCWGGVVLSVLLILGIAPALVLVLLWFSYLSLVTVGGVFLAFQWDNLLLETGLLAIFFAPRSLWPRLATESPPSCSVHGLLKWLLFRLMFLSGVVKLTSGDSTWSELTALNFHYETQPLPVWASWYVHHLPGDFHSLSVAAMFVIELLVPFLIFGPRRLRHFGCAGLVGFMAIIAATGNYCFFNLLTAVLCILLLDDAFLRRCFPRRWVARLDEPRPAIRFRWVRKGFAALLAAFILAASTLEGVPGSYPRGRMPKWWESVPRWVHSVRAKIRPFRSVNSYGLFRVMTRTRPEIVIEGSADGRTWLEYGFRWKPGDLNRPPAFVEPHQPRLDWQMWFAALGRYQDNPWFAGLMQRLLEGSPEVLDLLEHNPFPDIAPRSLRAVLYRYRFSDPATRRSTGAWWQRERLGLYCPPISLRGR